MRKLLRRAGQRQQLLAYFVIGLMLLLLAEALGEGHGLLVVFALWAAFLVILEFGYQKLISLELRNRRKWWAKARTWRRVIGFYVGAGCALVALLIHSPLVRYSLLALLAAGAVCFGIIRALQRADGI